MMKAGILGCVMVVFGGLGCGGPRTSREPAARAAKPAADADATAATAAVETMPDDDVCREVTPAQLRAVPMWAGWRTSGALDPCVRLSSCAAAGCASASCLHGHYGCLDSGTRSVQLEQQLGARFFVSVDCCPE